MKTKLFTIAMMVALILAAITRGQAQEYDGPCLPPTHGLDDHQSAFCGSTETQTIALSAGTNWFSTNLDITLDDLKAALVAATPDKSITIKGKNNNTVYIPRLNRWNGTLTWDVASMYRITVEEDCELVLEGMPLNPAQHPITIEGNGIVNWIGYPFAESMTPTAAFDGFAVNNDVVKYKTTNSKYVRGRWTNGVTSLDAGKGYLYISAPDAPDRTFTFPTSAK